MERRKFLVGTVATLGYLASGAARLQSMVSGRQPNVLLLMSDQHKRTCMGAYGDSVARTPNLDRLAASSVRFTNAYCTNPVCTPSRASILTGLYSHHLEAQDNTTPYRPEHRTMAHHFNAAGYMTALVGKMHWVDAQNHGFEYRVDFNDWYQFLGPKTQIYADEVGRPNSGSGLPEVDDFWRDEGDPWKDHRTLDHRQGSAAVGRVSLLQESDHFDEFIARESIRFLHNFGKGDQPFFLITSFLKPHDPFMPAGRFAKMFRAEDMKLPDSWGKADKSKLPRQVRDAIEHNGVTPELLDPSEARKHIAFYYANLAQMDDCLGRVVGAVQDLGLENDTIVCYTSDHGEMLGDLGLWQKFQFYEGSCGVPLLVRIPGANAGVCHTPVSLVSVSSTLTELAGVKQVTPNDGMSLAPWVRSPATQQSYGPVFAEYGLNSRQPKYMMRQGDWKFTYWVHDIPELYNLRLDPQELHNVAADPANKEIVEQMKSRLLAWHESRLG